MTLRSLKHELSPENPVSTRSPCKIKATDLQHITTENKHSCSKREDDSKKKKKKKKIRTVKMKPNQENTDPAVP
jgi:hypothetical protein